MAENSLANHIDELIAEGVRIRRAGVPKVSPTATSTWDLGYEGERDPEPHRYTEFDAVALKQWRSDIKMVAAAAVPPGHHVLADALKLDDLYHDEHLLDDGTALLQSLKQNIERGLLIPIQTLTAIPRSRPVLPDDGLMRRILTDVFDREQEAPLMNYTLQGVDKITLMRAIRRLRDLGWLEAVDCSTRSGMDYAPRLVTAAGQDWLEGPKNDVTGEQVTDKSNHQTKKYTDAISVIEQISVRFNEVIKQLRHRHEDRPTLDVADEYDVQDLLHSLLLVHFDDIRAEECAPSTAGAKPRMDLILKAHRIVIETKMVRKGLTDRKLTEELLIDLGSYPAHPDCGHLVMFIFDPNECIRNPAALRDIENRGSVPVKVLISPRR